MRQMSVSISGLVNNKLTGTVDYFNKKHKRHFDQQPAPDVHGTASIPKQKQNSDCYKPKLHRDDSRPQQDQIGD